MFGSVRGHVRSEAKLGPHHVVRSLHTAVGLYAEFDRWQNSKEHEIGVR